MAVFLTDSLKTLIMIKLVIFYNTKASTEKSLDRLLMGLVNSCDCVKYFSTHRVKQLEVCYKRKYAHIEGNKP